MSHSTSESVVPIIEEELRVSADRKVTARVQVHLGVSERVERAVADLAREDVEITRTPVGAFVDAAPAPRQEGDTYVVPVVEERLVVEKRLFLKEEVRMTLRRTTERFEQDVSLASTEVTVAREELGSQGQS